MERLGRVAVHLCQKTKLLLAEQDVEFEQCFRAYEIADTFLTRNRLLWWRNPSSNECLPLGQFSDPKGESFMPLLAYFPQKVPSLGQDSGREAHTSYLVER